MSIRSIAISFRIEADFHALNNEGSGGTNVMEPRRIAIGDKEYDGISGEIVRRHILENFVRLCQQNDVPVHTRCQGLVPDRGKLNLRAWLKKNNDISWENAKKQNRDVQVKRLLTDHYRRATQELVSSCALCDIGGYLIAFQDADAINDTSPQHFEGTLKRDSCFEIGWLIPEHPAIVDYT